MKKKIQKQTPEYHPDSNVAAIEKKNGVLFRGANIHYNSQKPAKFQAEAITYGKHIYLSQGQEKRLSHELTHFKQQESGIVQATHYENGYPVNNSIKLEQHASKFQLPDNKRNASTPVIQKSAPGLVPNKPVFSYTNDWRAEKTSIINLKGKQQITGTDASVDPPGGEVFGNDYAEINWVRFHLINENLGGPGHTCANIIPASIADNNEWYNDFEQYIVREFDQLKWINVQVWVTYYDGCNVPETIYGESYSFDSMNNTWIPILGCGKRIKLMTPPNGHANPERRGRKAWQREEDQALLALVEQHGENWAVIAQFMDRGQRACRDRYKISLCPNLNLANAPWNKEEDERLWQHYKEIGAKWNAISVKMSPRSSVQCKDRIKILSRAAYSIENLLNRKVEQEKPSTSPLILPSIQGMVLPEGLFPDDLDLFLESIDFEGL